ncbi:hypothetical protein XU18_0118 [Perkinsela sp. CCAP 1560/4]|nr:hypothetical protein XU18_0118 [Perkinsela sp. CCAP 1560/4]|eukprot:KNH09433.1 hypothetical protein XU18_0118 [Perkinsela sp. CCAP 1560/4]
MIERTAEGRINTTDWEDVQYRFGNKVGAYVHRESEILDQQEREKAPDTFPVYDPMMEKRADSEGSDTELENIRAQIRRDLIASRKPHAHIEKTDYAHYWKAVTEQSMQRNVLLVIYEEHIGECTKLLNILNELAKNELKTISIVCIRADEARVCMEPSHLPCVVIYSMGAVVHTWYGSAIWGGKSMDENRVLELIQGAVVL